MARTAPALNPEVHAPFAYRLSIPWLAGLIHPTDPRPFQALTLVSLLLLGYAFLRRIHQMGLSQGVGIFLVALLFLQPYLSGFVVFDYFQAGDLLVLALLLFMIEALERDAHLVLGSLFLAAVLTRETALFIVPLVLLRIVSSSDVRQRSAALSSLTACTPGLALWIVLRLYVPIGNPEYSMLGLLVNYAPDLISPEKWFRIVFSALTPLCFIPLAWRRDWSLFSRSHPYIVSLIPLFLVTAFIGGDKERLVAPAYLSLLLFVAFVHKQRSILHVREFVWLLFISGLATSMHFMWAAFPIPHKVAYYILCAALDGLVAIAAYRLRQVHLTPRDRTTTEVAGELGFLVSDDDSSVKVQSDSLTRVPDEEVPCDENVVGERRIVNERDDDKDHDKEDDTNAGKDDHKDDDTNAGKDDHKDKSKEDAGTRTMDSLNSGQREN